MKSDIYIHKSGIFAQCADFSFAWSGGRLLIMDKNQNLVDFGDGGMSMGKFGHHSGRFKHRVLGEMEADDGVFKLYDYNLEFDFLVLKNSKWIDRCCNKWTTYYW